MKHSRVPAASFAAVLSPLAALSPLAGIAASLTGALPARGVDVPFTERLISAAANGARFGLAPFCIPLGRAHARACLRYCPEWFRR